MKVFIVEESGSNRRLYLFIVGESVDATDEFGNQLRRKFDPQYVRYSLLQIGKSCANYIIPSQSWHIRWYVGNSRLIRVPERKRNRQIKPFLKCIYFPIFSKRALIFLTGMRRNVASKYIWYNKSIGSFYISPCYATAKHSCECLSRNDC